jgi:F0F1-type ATP synthase assembly protein I
MEKSKGAAVSAAKDISTSKPKGNGTLFVIAAMDMSWRLAIAVLVPIIGGFELDKHLGSTPVLTIIGFIIAMAGLFMVLKRTTMLANEKFKTRAQR